VSNDPFPHGEEPSFIAQLKLRLVLGFLFYPSDSFTGPPSGYCWNDDYDVFANGVAVV
jgi:hypothetical protein